jgi:dolichol-phosphate mannosyltransferase
MLAGIAYARGDVLGVISADLQDPVDLFRQMLREWENGKKLVLGVREGREDEAFSAFTARLTHSLIRRFVSQNFPASGFDFWLFDRSVADHILRIDEKNSMMNSKS